MKKLTTSQIRKIWLDFFASKSHHIEESASLIPNNDPTLLWINAGIAPLKKYFDGSEVPKNRRLTNSQKCIRTNDIENVGHTARHHTFFEMLGNFSIGDYFKDEVQEWAIELLTSDKYYGIDLDRLYFSVYPTDTEAYNNWIKLGVKPEHIVKTEDHNFWEIGEGPCGPCTEIFFDRGKKYGKLTATEALRDDVENDRYIEIWNIVFSQYNSQPNILREQYKELPSKNIDTGAGLERLAFISQNVDTNYDTDTFKQIISRIEKHTDVKYEGQFQFKVISDHIRTVTFAICDGATLSNEGRGYVLRRLLRRAVKQGSDLNIKDRFLADVANTVIDVYKDFYPYLEQKRELVNKIIDVEEQKFLVTLSKGLDILKKMLKSISEDGVLAGHDAFMLYDTYGFPIQLTCECCEAENIKVDLEGFEQSLQHQKNLARNARKDSASMSSQNEEWIKFKDQSIYLYDVLHTKSKVIKVFKEGIVLDKTPFYAESGGQVADRGTINGIDVLDVKKLPNKQHIHLGHYDVNEGDIVECKVFDKIREEVTSNHSATHLLYKALRDNLGDHVSQQGSFVSDSIIRFDFNHYSLLTENEILTIEKDVNKLINKKIDVKVFETTIEEAKKLGAQAEFGEKYDDLVRVVNMTETVDLCGGTHVSNTADITEFAVMSVYSIGSGIYRIEASSLNVEPDIMKYTKNLFVEINTLTNKALNIIMDLVEKNIDPNEVIKINTKSKSDKGSLLSHVKHSIKSTKLFKTLTENLVEQTFINKIIHGHDTTEEYLNNLQGTIMSKAIDKRIVLTEEGIFTLLGSYQDIINLRIFIENLKKIVKDLDVKSKQLLAQSVTSDLDKYSKHIVEGKLVAKTENIDNNAIKSLIDSLYDKFTLNFIFIANVLDDKLVFVCKSNKSIHCGNTVKEAAKIAQGGGGGRPDFAQAGGKDITKVDDVLKYVRGL